MLLMEQDFICPSIPPFIILQVSVSLTLTGLCDKDYYVNKIVCNVHV